MPCLGAARLSASDCNCALHDAGSAAIKRLTGATYMVMNGDESVVESGGRTDFQYGGDTTMRYPPTAVDRVLHDGDKVTLGGTSLVAHLTPGHTRGCTTWTMQVQESGRTYDVVIVGSPNVNEGYKLVKNAAYPEIAADYERTFRVLRSLPVDVFLGAHALWRVTVNGAVLTGTLTLLPSRAVVRRIDLRKDK